MEEENKLEETIYDIVQYMISNSIYNTIVTTTDNDNEYSIVLKTEKPKIKELLGHLHKYKKIKEDDEIIGESCPICMDDYKINQYKRVLDKCSHYFHKKCIDKWLRNNQGKMNCPICRTNYDNRIVL